MPYSGQNKPLCSGDILMIGADTGLNAEIGQHVFDGFWIAEVVVDDGGHFRSNSSQKTTKLITLKNLASYNLSPSKNKLN